MTLDKVNNTGGAITFDFDDLFTGTATSGLDYTAIPANAVVSIANGASTGTFTVTVVNDGIQENLETVVAAISNPSFPAVTIATAQATANITDTAVANLSVTTHGAESGTNIVYTVDLGEINGTGSAITFDLVDTLTGTATSGSDYTAIPPGAKITVANGSATGTLTVTVTDDNLVEPTENVRVSIANPSDGKVSLGTSTATASITDNDSATITIATTSDAVEPDVNGVFTITMTKPSSTDTVINYTVGGTATPDVDYVALSGTVTILAGQTSATITVVMIDDTILEPDETVIATLTGVSIGNSNISLGGTVQATVTITDHILAAIPNQSATEFVPLTFTVVASDFNPDIANFTYSLDAASLAKGMIINASTGQFNWTPGEPHDGLHSVTISVVATGIGGTQNDSRTFTISVAEVNANPVLGAIGHKTLMENATLAFTATAFDSDTPVNALTFTLDANSLAKGMTIHPTTGQFSWLPDFRYTTPDAHVHAVTVTVTDNGNPNLSDSETFNVTVNPIILSQTTGVYLDIDPDFTPNSINLNIRDINGGNTNDTLTIRVEGNVLVIRDPRNTVGTSVLGGTQVNANEVRVNLSLWTRDVVVDLGGGHDVLDIGSLTGVNGGLVVNGGTGFDQVRFVAGTTSTLSNGSDVNVNAESIYLNRATLTVGTSGANTGDIILNGLDTSGAVVNRNYVGVQILASTLTATGSGSVIMSGTGGTVGTARHGVSLETGTVISVATGDIAISGTARPTTSMGNSGVLISASTLTQTGAGGGAITLNGTGSGMGAGNTGVTLTRGSQVNALGAGTVSITGTGGGTGTRAGANDGVKIDTASIVRSVNGDITLSGSGGATGGKGINLITTASIISTGAGNVSLTNTGGILGSSNSGIAISTATVSVTTGNLTLIGSGGNGVSLNTGVSLYKTTLNQLGAGGGAIVVTGAGNGTGTTNHGVLIDYQTRITALGAGAISISGTATTRAGATTNNVGLEIMRASVVTAVTGNIGLTGVGSSASTGASNRGILIQTSQVRTTGIGSISITGTGGKGTHYNDGLIIYSRSFVTSGGSLTLTGTADGTGSYNHGIHISASTATSVQLSIFSGSGGGVSGNLNHGIYLVNASTTSPTLTGVKGAGTKSRALIS